MASSPTLGEAANIDQSQDRPYSTSSAENKTSNLPTGAAHLVRSDLLLRMQQSIISVVQNKVSCFVQGGSATGRTTGALLSVIFFPPEKKTIFIAETREAAEQATQIALTIKNTYKDRLHVSSLLRACSSSTTISGSNIARLIVTTPGKLVAALRDRTIVPEEVGFVIIDGGHTLLDPQTGSGDHCRMALERLSIGVPTLLVISNADVPIPDYVKAWQPEFIRVEMKPLTRRGNVNHVHSSILTRNNDIVKLVEEAGPVLTLVIAGSIPKAEELQRVLGSERFTLVHSRLPDELRWSRTLQFIQQEISLIGCRIPPSGLQLADVKLVVFAEPPTRWACLADLLRKFDNDGNLLICYDPEDTAESERMEGIYTHFKNARNGHMPSSLSVSPALKPTRRLQVGSVPKASKEEVAQWFPPEDRIFHDSGVGTGYRHFDFETVALAEQFMAKYQYFRLPGEDMYSLHLTYVEAPKPKNRAQRQRSAFSSQSGSGQTREARNQSKWSSQSGSGQTREARNQSKW